MQKDKHLYNELHCDQWQLGGNFMDKLHPDLSGVYGLGNLTANNLLGVCFYF